MTTPYSHEPWEGDAAESACRQWISSWRSNHPEDERPSLRFAAHLGGEAFRLQVEGATRVELQRMFANCGYDGVCICGAVPESMPGKPPMLEMTGRRRRPRRAGAA